MWEPRDFIALVLAIALVLLIISPAAIMPWRELSPDHLAILKEVALVLVGALAGYIGAKKSE